MFKKLFLTSFVLLSLTSFIYPTKKENTKIFDYCYSLEKILSRNSTLNRENISENVKSISYDIAKIGIGKTKGNLISEIIDQYKNKKNSFIINLVPNKIYCLAGYWTEYIKPGIFESIFFDKSKKAINEFKDFKKEVDTLINEINSEYKSIKNQLENIF